MSSLEGECALTCTVLVNVVNRCGVMDGWCISSWFLPMADDQPAHQHLEKGWDIFAHIMVPDADVDILWKMS